MNTNKIKVMLVDDHAVVREGYRRLIEKHEDMTVVAEAAEGSKAYQEYKRHKPDVVVLDLSLPGKGGVEVIRHLRQWHDAACILVFTMHQNPTYALQAFQAGAKGYITKSSEPEILVSAIHDIFNGRRAISPDIARELAMARIEDESTFLDGLTAREFEIFRMIANANTIPEIAKTLNLSTKTVFNYSYLIKSKLGLSSDIELAHLATRMRIVDPDKLWRDD